MLSITRKGAAIAVFIFVAAFARTGFAQSGPEFSLRAIEGETVTSQSLRGEVAVLAFGASWLMKGLELRVLRRP